MKIPIITDVLEDWKYNQAHSSPTIREYSCTDSYYGVNTYVNITKRNGEFFLTASIMSRDKQKDSFDTPEEANNKAIEFMKNNP